jgi:sulfur-carrier protein
MSVTVRIPTVLRKVTGGLDELEAEGLTVAEVFAHVGRMHAQFLPRVTREGGELQPFLNVFVNGDDIRFAAELETPVRDGDEISIIPSIAGGSVDVARIAATLLPKVRRHSESEYPLEACGLLVGSRDDGTFRVARIIPCPNTAEPVERSRRFRIDPRAVLNVDRSLRGTAERIVGFYHSHPDAEAGLSATDLEYVRLWPATLWLVVPVPGGRAAAPRAWVLEETATADPCELPMHEDVALTGAICPD